MAGTRYWSLVVVPLILFAGCSGGGNSSTSSTGGKSVAQLIAAGDAALARGDVDEAWIQFDEAVAVDADSPQARERRAAAFLRKGKFDQAIDDCKEALKINSKLPSAYFTRGQAYLGIGEREKAIEDFNKAVDTGPTRVDLLTARGKLFQSMANGTLVPKDAAKFQQSALSDFSRALDSNPGDTDIRLRRAEIRVDIDDFERALDDCNQVIEKEPNLAAAHVVRARAEIELGECDKAITDCDSAIALDETRIDAYAVRAKARLENTPDLRTPADIAEYGKAAADCEKAITLFAVAKGSVEEMKQIRSTSALAHELRGAIYDSLRIPKKALAEFEKAAALDPFLPSTLLRRAIARAKSDDVLGALSDCNAAISIDNTRAEAFVTRGQVLASKLRLDEAVKDYTQALVLKDKFTKAYSNRALAYSAWAELEVINAVKTRDKAELAAAVTRAKEYQQKCIDDATKAIDCNPRFTQAYIIRGLQYAKIQHFQKAYEDFDEAIRLNPRSYQAYFCRGSLLAKQHRLGEAIADFTALINLAPSSPEPYRQRALAYRAQGNGILFQADVKRVKDLAIKKNGAANSPDDPSTKPPSEADLDLPAASQAFEDAKKELEAALDAGGKDPPKKQDK